MKPCMLLKDTIMLQHAYSKIASLKKVFLVVKRLFTKFCDIMLQCPKHNLRFPTYDLVKNRG